MKLKLTSLGLFIFFILLYACQNGKNNTDTDNKAQNDQYLDKGKVIAGATFSVLSGKLQAAMKEGGVANAVSYCNLAAYPLVDSLSKVHKATIRRTSSKVRNPQNKPTLEEKVVLNGYERKSKTGEPLKPTVHSIDDQTMAFYAPIQTVELCLQCHGKVGETLKQEDYALIQELYPNDEAIGYTAGAFRGMWSIRFKR